MPKNLKKFGDLLKSLRMKSDLSIREACKLTGYDPSNWSKIERGLISPPADEKILASWGKLFKIKKEELRSFIDDAQIAQGIIPDDILSNHEMVQLMPAFFRTLRNKKPTKEELDNLVNLIKNA